MEENGLTKIADMMTPFNRQIEEKMQFKQRWLQYGFAMTPNVLMFDSDLSMPSRALAVIYLCHGFGKDKAWPPNWLLELETGLKKSQLAVYKKELFLYPSPEKPLFKNQRTGRNSIVFVDLDVLNSVVKKVVKRMEDAKILEEKRTKGNKG